MSKKIRCHQICHHSCFLCAASEDSTHDILIVNSIFPIIKIVKIVYRPEYNENMRDNPISDCVFNESTKGKVFTLIAFKSYVTQFEDVICFQIFHISNRASGLKYIFATEMMLSTEKEPSFFSFTYL